MRQHPKTTAIKAGRNIITRWKSLRRMIQSYFFKNMKNIYKGSIKTKTMHLKILGRKKKNQKALQESHGQNTKPTIE